MKYKSILVIMAITFFIFLTYMVLAIILGLSKFDLVTLSKLSAGILLLMTGEFMVYYFITRKR